MFDEKLLKKYEEIKKDNMTDMTKLYCLSCVDASLKWLNAELATTDEDRLHMASAVYDEWRDTDIQISVVEVKNPDLIAKLFKYQN